MFAVLQVEEYEKGIVNRLQNLFAGNKAKLNYFSVKGAAPFVVIKIKEGKKGIDWKEVLLSAGGCAGNMVLPDGIQIPVSSGLSEFEPKIFTNILLFNNMLEIIRRLNNKNISVTVLDKNACLAKSIDKLFDCARHITVLTDGFAKYKVASDRIMESCGGSITLKDYDSSLEKSDIVFADKYDVKKLENCQTVFCAGKTAKNENCITGYDTEYPEQLLKNKPSDINSFLFVSALYELNSLKGYDDLMFSKLQMNNEKIEKEEIVEKLRQYCGKI